MSRKRPFSRIAPAITSTLDSLGFNKLSARDSAYAQGGAAWCSPHGEAHCIIVFLQLWKWGYDPWFGSSFTINFRRLSYDCEATSDTKGLLDLRIMSLVSKNECEQIAALQNAVIAKGRIPTREEYQHLKLIPMTEFNVEEYEKRATPVDAQSIQFSDLWLAFIDDGDVDAWCTFLKSWLPIGIGRFREMDRYSGCWLDTQSIPWAN